MSEDTTDASLDIEVTVDGVTVSVSGPSPQAEAWFERLEERYLKGAATEQVAEPASNGGTGTVADETSTEVSAAKSRTLPEYYKMVDSPTKQESALIVGWFVEKHTEADEFTKNDLKEYAKESGIQLGKNLSRDIKAQIKEGNIHEVDDRDDEEAYRTTITGEEFVEDELLIEDE